MSGRGLSEPEYDHIKLERTLNKLQFRNDFGPPWGFASLGDPYGANQPGFYAERKAKRDAQSKER